MKIYLSKINELILNNLDFNFTSNTLNRLKNTTSNSRKDEIRATEILFSKVFPDYDVLTIGVSKNGKPYFNESKVKFNYSHSSNLLALAVSDSEVGIDVQKISLKTKKVASKYINKDEEKFLFNDEIYTLIWTIKEATIKLFDKTLFDLKDVHILDILKIEDYFKIKVKFDNQNLTLISTKIDDYFVSYTSEKSIEFILLN